MWSRPIPDGSCTSSWTISIPTSRRGTAGGRVTPTFICTSFPPTLPGSTLVEVWFSILSRQALRHLSCTHARQLRETIDRFVRSNQQTATPFEWTKTEVHPSQPKTRYSDLCK